MAPSRELFSNPKHPYTKALLSSIPSIDPENKSKAIELEEKYSAMIPHQVVYLEQDAPMLLKMVKRQILKWD